MSGTTRKTARALTKHGPLAGPQIATAIIQLLLNRDARTPGRCMAVGDLADETGLTVEVILRIAPRIVLGDYAVLPFTNLGRGVLGFYLADAVGTNLAAELLLEQVLTLQSRASELKGLSQDMEFDNPPGDSGARSCELRVQTGRRTA